MSRFVIAWQILGRSSSKLKKSEMYSKSWKSAKRSVKVHPSLPVLREEERKEKRNRRIRNQFFIKKNPRKDKLLGKLSFEVITSLHLIDTIRHRKHIHQEL
jgi:hypothetical protein